jgi:hypothetical protein
MYSSLANPKRVQCPTELRKRRYKFNQIMGPDEQHPSPQPPTKEKERLRAESLSDKLQ